MSDSYKIYASQDWVNEKVPEDAGNNQQLITDADGNAKWEERTHWSESHEEYLLSDYEITISQTDNMGYVLQPLTFQPEVGKTYTVKWNNTDYQIVAGTYMYQVNETESVKCVALGNRASIGEADTGEPFAILIYTPELAVTMNMYAVALSLDGSTEVTLSIKGEIETVHQLDLKYLPTTLRGQKQIIINRSSDDVYSTTFPFEEAYAMDEAELQNSIIIKEKIGNAQVTYSVTGVTKFDSFPIIRFSYVVYTDAGPYKEEIFISWISTESEESFVKDDYTSGTRFNMTVREGSGFMIGTDTVDYLQNKFVLAPMTSTTIGGAIQGTTLKMTDKTLDVADNIPQINSAAVGQTIVVKAVDANGRPTEWEAVDIVTEDRVNELIAAALAAIPNAEEASF